MNARIHMKASALDQCKSALLSAFSRPEAIHNSNTAHMEPETINTIDCHHSATESTQPELVCPNRSTHRVCVGAVLRTTRSLWRLYWPA